MKRVLTAAVLVPIVLGILFRGPDWLFTLVVALVAFLCLHEYLGIAAGHGFHPSRGVLWLAFLAWFLLLAGTSSSDDRLLVEMGAIGVMFLLLLLTAPLLMAAAMRAPELREALPSAAAGLLALPYIAFSLGSMVGIRQAAWGKFLLLYLFLVVWSGDIFAYYVGRAFGRRKLAPRVSPGKTWEGTWASLLGSTVLGTLIFVFAPAITGFLLRVRLLAPEDAAPSPALLSPSIWIAILLSALINVAAQFGDLAESAIKRGAGVKDSGSILPGHGGMLDRVDALLFAAPVLCYYAAFHQQSLAPYVSQ